MNDIATHEFWHASAIKLSRENTVKNCGPSRDDEYQNINYLVVHLYPFFFFAYMQSMTDFWTSNFTAQWKQRTINWITVDNASCVHCVFVLLLLFFLFFFFNEKVLVFIFNPIKKNQLFLHEIIGICSKIKRVINFIIRPNYTTSANNIVNKFINYPFNLF